MQTNNCNTLQLPPPTLHLQLVQTFNSESDSQMGDQTQKTLVISPSSLFSVNKGGISQCVSGLSRKEKFG